MDKWTACHNADRNFRGVVPFAQHLVELPSPAIQAGEQAFELDATATVMTSPRSLLPTMLEPLDETVPSTVREPSPDWPLRTG